MEIYERIIDLLSRKELTQKALCKKLNVPQSTLSNWLTKGRSIPAEKIIPICEFFNVSTDELLTGNNSPSNTASHISHSAIVQGNHATTLIVKNGETTERKLSEQEAELLRIYNGLSVKNKTALLTHAYKLEEEPEK